MKEYDLDSYRRKFHQTVTVLRDEDGKRFAKYIEDISTNDDNEVVFRNNGEWLKAEPEYFRWEGRYYYNQHNKLISVRRRIRKCWQIGLSIAGHILFSPTKQQEVDGIHLDPFKPLEIDIENALKKEGLISPQLYLTKHSVLFLDKEVGLRKGSKFLVNPSVWQEVNDSLQGYKCSISQ